MCVNVCACAKVANINPGADSGVSVPIRIDDKMGLNSLQNMGGEGIVATFKILKKQRCTLWVGASFPDFL